MHEKRIAEYAVKLWRGHLEEVADWLESMGARVEREEHVLIATSLAQDMRVGLAVTDPNTCAVQLGFVLAGQWWPWAYPGLLPAVNRLWKQATREEAAQWQSR